MTERVVPDAAVEAARPFIMGICKGGRITATGIDVLISRALTAALPHLLGDFGLAMRYSDEIDRLNALVAERDARIAKLEAVLVSAYSAISSAPSSRGVSGQTIEACIRATTYRVPGSVLIDLETELEHAHE